ncbi:hypothetical protein C8R47DRAFT_426174 [Mycena vitilis]|nr:hypothetical protein C8R47DRAFT_426174 [Mycena vitilis]
MTLTILGMYRAYVSPRPSAFDSTCVRVIYFDVYDTLNDRETGILNALQPLLNQSLYAFTRHEALSFYFESETEMKERTPRAPYAQIQADTYCDVALRLGIAPVSTTDVTLFAQSAGNWPCIPDAGWLLNSLAHSPKISLAAIADVDHGFLLRTPAFPSLAPFFDSVFTWDSCRAYKPDPSAFYAPLRFYDAHVPRTHLPRVRQSAEGLGARARIGLACGLDTNPGQSCGEFDQRRRRMSCWAFRQSF